MRSCSSNCPAAWTLRSRCDLVPHMSRPARLAIWSLFLCVGGLLLGGCDEAGSKRASLYESLTGTWTIERLEGGGFNYTNRLNERHPRGVEITFRDQEEGRTYRIVSPPSGDSLTVLAEGTVVLPGDDELRMASGFDRRVAWRYGFPTRSRANFEVQFGSQVFLRALFSDGSRTPNLEMTLVLDGD
jgi:hypothetical protein